MDRLRVEIDYTNWRGERSKRIIVPIEWYFGATHWHPDRQWMLKAHDLEKNKDRDFAVQCIHSWKPAP